MRHTRLDSLLLAGVGTLAVHEIAYLPGSVEASLTGGVSHSHIPLMWGLGGSIAIAALVRYIVVSMRSRGAGRWVDAQWLGLTMAALYVSQEAAERALSGSAAISLLTQPVLWLGLAAVPLVAWALARLANTIVELVAPEIARVRRVGLTRVLAPRPTQSVVPGVLRLAHAVVRRGPPVVSY